MDLAYRVSISLSFVRSFSYKNRISELSKDYLTGSPEFINQNMSQIGQGLRKSCFSLARQVSTEQRIFKTLEYTWKKGRNLRIKKNFPYKLDQN